jgi:uncharacterized membrane protein YgcG
MNRCFSRVSLALASLFAAVALSAAVLVAPVAAVDPGPPYPDPVIDQAVYDHAGALSEVTEREAERIIDGIEARTGAEVVVYTQVKPSSDTPEAAEADARALMDQWGIGRRGFDDGLVILYDLDASLVHGQVQLYAGSGYRATFLGDGERQAIYENEMLPLLRQGDLDAATLRALELIDANATPEHAATLQLARTANAVMGLVGAPLIFVLLVGWAFLSWLRHGRDPQYLDDPSILMPAPPPEMTAATGALLMEGRSTRRALTTAMLDLASRGELSFRDESALLEKKVGVELLPAAAQESPDVFRNRRKPLGPAEKHALAELRELGDDVGGYIAPEDLLKFGTSVSGFDERLEKHAVAKGWFRDRPSRVTNRWRGIGGLEIAGGVAAFIVGVNLPSSGLLLIAIALGAAGIVTFVIASWMPARTMAGAMVYAMLAAYRRTLQKTLAQARSMNEVVASHVVPWLETPDQAVVWGVALGLHSEIEQVLQRSLEDLHEGRTTPAQAWVPAWYGSSSGLSSAGAGRSSTWGGVAPGLLSASAIPSFGGMMSTLGTIGNSPSSSGDSGGGGFGGGGGGGGGGAGGGF